MSAWDFGPDGQGASQPHVSAPVYRGSGIQARAACSRCLSGAACRLTPREWRAVALLAEGMTNPEIAAKMHTTDNVIKNYLRFAFDKTGMNSRLELALWYVKYSEDLQ